MTTTKTDAQRAHELRKDLSISQSDVAAALNVSAGYVNNWEHGKSPVPTWAMSWLLEAVRVLGDQSKRFQVGVGYIEAQPQYQPPGIEVSNLDGLYAVEDFDRLIAAAEAARDHLRQSTASAPPESATDSRKRPS